MNNQLVYSATPMTVGASAVAIMAAFGGSNDFAFDQALENEPPILIADRATVIDGQSSSTFGPTTAKLSFANAGAEADFGVRLAAIYASLCEGQEPLGEEFEAVWDAHAEGLYEA